MLLRLIPVILAAVWANLWASSGFAQIPRATDEFIGPVRTVMIKTFGYAATETYDRAGRLTTAIMDIPHAQTATHSLFQYDQGGHLLEELVLDPNGKLMFRKQVAYARDAAGRDTASVTTSDNGDFQHAEFSLYDRRGRLWEQVWVNHAIAYKSLFDVFGRRIYSARYGKDQLLGELKYQYDVQGRVQEVVIYNPQGMVIGRVTNEYDKAGQRERATTETWDDNLSRTWVTTYEYDAMGNWIKELTTEQSPSSPNLQASPVSLVQERVIQYYHLTEKNTP